MGNEGRELQRVFAKYYVGREVTEADLEVLDALSKTDYIEYYEHDGRLFARAGPIGALQIAPHPLGRLIPMALEREFWIPNLSGEVAGKNRISSCIRFYDSDYFSVELVDRRIEVVPKHGSILTPAFKMTVTIPERDGRGLCHLRCEAESSILNIYLANRAWNEVRRALDSCCGTVYDCTGMNEPFSMFRRNPSERPVPPTVI